MTATEQAEQLTAHKAKRDWWQIASIAAIVALLCWISWDKAVATTRAEAAEANAVSFAEQVQTACAAPDELVTDWAICKRADAVVALPDSPPAQAIVGPQGPPGPAGVDSVVPGPIGLTGLASLIPGPIGETGPQGDASLIPGPAGADSTVPGPAGADSTVPGPAGPAGADGRGITSVACVDSTTSSDWVVTFTDGATSTAAGPCRTIPTPPVEVAP